jgi:putative ABC transport system permease protein
MLELRHIHKDYLVDKKPFTALKDLNLCFEDKGFIAILGPSGCGKTTLLNIIGGLDHYTSGDLLINGRSTKGFKDRDWDTYRNKRIGFVFQSYNLISHYTILQNVEIAMTLNGTKRKERAARAKEVLGKVGLGDVLSKKPAQLSGGQMQRVAIARALVNNPDIILADEPTGALDSVTSVQVLDLIKEVGKERCVIMVTHNQELAQKYADRIVEMKDGEVVHDITRQIAIEKTDEAEVAVAHYVNTPVYVPKEDAAPISGKTGEKKTSMSFLTALRSSGQNVLTKKGRTALTAVACSFGIIGVALVLATRNGFSIYVGNVESDVAGSVPITVQPTQYDYSTVYTNNTTPYPDNTDVHIYDGSQQAFVAHRNNYTQDYFNYIEKTLPNSGDKSHQGLSQDIIYNRDGLDFHFITKDGTKDTYMHVDQYKSAGGLSYAVSAATSLPTTVMHEIFADQKYDVIYGRKPTSPNDLVLIIDKYNQVDLAVLKKLGIVDSDTVSHAEKIAFKDIVYDGDGDTSYKEYKCYKNSDYYQIKTATPITNTTETWKLKEWNGQVDENTVTLAPGTTAQYRLTKEMSTQTLTHYSAPASYADCYNNDATYNPITCKIVGVLRPSTNSYISLMPASVGYLTSLKNEISNDYNAGELGNKLATIQSSNFFIPRRYKTSGDPASGAADNDGIAILEKNSAALLTSLSAQSSLSSTSLLGAFTGTYWFFPAYSTTDKTYGGTSSFSTYITYCEATGASFNDLDPAQIPAIGDYNAWLTLLQSPDFYNGTSIRYLVYFSSYSVVTSILIFPAALTTKDNLRNYLSAYNDGKADVDQIKYDDVMSTFTSSLGILINVISAILIVFASISLVVSSVMTAIITYVSVIERTKEIGVLRACGARKIDVGRLFEAECIITGFVAGVIGIGVTLIACIPINAILDHLYPKNNLSSIAQLNPWHALILLALSIVLAFLSGFIPSRIAAKKDPVVCLRSE